MAFAEKNVWQSFSGFTTSDNARVHAGNRYDGDHYGDNHYHSPPGDLSLTHPVKTSPTAAERPSSPVKPFSNVPFAQDPDYIDRASISNELQHRLLPGARLALVGLGGAG